MNIGILWGNQGRHEEALGYFEQAARLGDGTGAQYAAQVRRMLGREEAPAVEPAQAAFAAFQQANSLAAMGQAVARFPLLRQADFVAAIEQAIAQQVPSTQRPMFVQRVGWLRQIVNMQK